jgi:Caspase domain
MDRIKRRQFLQFAGSALAAIGLSHLDIQQQGLRYARVLAQSTPRKRALLIGINDYPDNLRFTPLKGCITDVELQKELLVRRFRFSSNDI